MGCLEGSRSRQSANSPLHRVLGPFRLWTTTPRNPRGHAERRTCAQSARRHAREHLGVCHFRRPHLQDLVDQRIPMPYARNPGPPRGAPQLVHRREPAAQQPHAARHAAYACVGSVDKAPIRNSHLRRGAERETAGQAPTSLHEVRVGPAVVAAGASRDRRIRIRRTRWSGSLPYVAAWAVPYSTFARTSRGPEKSGPDVRSLPACHPTPGSTSK